MVIKIFGKLTDIVGGFEYAYLGELSTVQALREQLAVIFPELAHTHYFVVVNSHKAAEEQLLATADEIALLPPFSGG